MSTLKSKEGTNKPTSGIYEVQSILQRGTSAGQKFYLVKWKGYTDQQATWEPESNLTGCTEAILQFEKIIKAMEYPKTQKSSPSSQKNNKSKSKKKQRTSTISLSNQLQKKNTENLPSEKKNSQGQAKYIKKIKDIKELSERKGTLNHIKKQKKEESQNSSKLSHTSSSENDLLEATTAQTIPTKENAETHLNAKISNKNSESNLGVEKSNFLISQNSNQKLSSVKVQNQSNRQENLKSKRANLKRQREKKEIPEKQAQKIIKKNKISPPQQILRSTNQQEVIPNEEKEGQILDLIHKVLSQSRALDKKDKQSQIQQENLKQSQKEKENQDKISDTKNCIKNENVEKLDKVSVSRRFMLCQERFFQLTSSFLGGFSEKLISNFKIQENEKDRVQTTKLLSKFIDLTRVQFYNLNKQMSKVILDKDEVKNMDEAGELLFCRIQAMIKTTECIEGIQREQWVCVLSNSEQDEKESRENHFFVRVDDLKRDSWRKQFRIFMLGNF